MKNIKHGLSIPCAVLCGLFWVCDVLKSSAGVIAVTNSIPWSLNVVGIPGGIPNRTQIFTNMVPGSGSVEISNAVTKCPSNSVVFLPAGDYVISDGIPIIGSGVTIRGAGIGQTRLWGAQSNRAFFYIDGSPASEPIDIISGFSKGSSNIICGKDGFFVGGQIILSQLNDTNFVWARAGTERVLKQVARVISVDATVKSATKVSFWPPLVVDFSASLHPTVNYEFYPTPSFSGIEDMSLLMTNPIAPAYNVWYAGGYACWIKGVESSNCANVHFFFSTTLQTQVDACYAHDTSSINDGFGLELYGPCSGFLVWNNIFNKCFHGIINGQTVGSVFAYNFATNSFNRSVTGQLPSYNSNHGPHGLMNLWEGNYGEQFENDGYHGSTSSETLFRNAIHGMHPVYSNNRIMINLRRFSYNYNIVGNVLGHPSWTPDVYSITNNAYRNSVQIVYALGYPNVGTSQYSESNPITGGPGPFADPADNGGFDVRVEGSIYRHGNFDYLHKGVVWDSTNPDHTLPSSLFLSEKPIWFGNIPWPPIGPDVSPMVGVIPAERRFWQIEHKVKNLHIAP